VTLHAGDSPRSMASSLCAVALALMNRQCPPLPPSCGKVFAVSVTHRACIQLQAAIRCKLILTMTMQLAAPSGPIHAPKNHSLISSDLVADYQRPANRATIGADVSQFGDSSSLTQDSAFDLNASLLSSQN
jgi:hypothetical protein